MDAKTWADDYEPRFRALPRNRKEDTVRHLRQLIKDMYESGFGVAEIGRLLERDHTTIVYHLALMGFKPQAELAARSAAYYEYLAQYKEKRLSDLKEKEKARAKVARLETQRRKILAKKKTRVALLKKKVANLYAKGVPLQDICIKLQIPIGSVSYYLNSGSYKANRNNHTGKPRALAVQQISLKTGEVLQVYKNAQTAAIENGIDPWVLRSALRTNQYSSVAGGYKWKRVE